MRMNQNQLRPGNREQMKENTEMKTHSDAKRITWK